MIVGTAGHIDHGKTTLVQALTGVDTDRLPEEKARGITHRPRLRLQPLADGAILGFVDVPGHEKLIHNMLAGATGIDFALLVVAADDGVDAADPRAPGDPRPARHRPRRRGADQDATWSPPSASRQARERDRELLAGTGAGGRPIFPCPPITGEGVAALRAHLEAAAASDARTRGRRRASASPSTAASRCPAPARSSPARPSPARSASATRC